MEYFYDSYAVIEYFKGNEKFKKFFQQSAGVLTSMNLIEIHYSLLTEFSEQDADEAVKKFQIYLKEPSVDELIDASKFRKEQRKRNLSYTDCIGYIVAKKRGFKFLTGDKQFESLPNVEFVK